MTRAERRLLRKYEGIAKAEGITVQQALRRAAKSKTPQHQILPRGMFYGKLG